MKIVYEGEIVFIDDTIKCDKVIVLYKSNKYEIRHAFFNVKQFVINKKEKGLLGMIRDISEKVPMKKEKKKSEKIYTNICEYIINDINEFMYVCYHNKIRCKDNYIINTIEMMELELDSLVLKDKLVYKQNYIVKNAIEKVIEHSNGNFYYVKIVFTKHFECSNVILNISNMDSVTLSQKITGNALMAKFYIENIYYDIIYAIAKEEFCYSSASKLIRPLTYTLNYEKEENFVSIKLFRNANINYKGTCIKSKDLETFDYNIEKGCYDKEIKLSNDKTNEKVIHDFSIDDHRFFIVNTKLIFDLI